MLLLIQFYFHSLSPLWYHPLPNMIYIDNYCSTCSQYFGASITSHIKHRHIRYTASNAFQCTRLLYKDCDLILFTFFEFTNLKNIPYIHIDTILWMDCNQLMNMIILHHINCAMVVNFVFCCFFFWILSAFHCVNCFLFFSITFT